jgi:hypothetical protein
MARRSFLLKSTLSASLFDEFSSSYQTYNPSLDHLEKPFVYVDPLGNIKLLTNMVSDNESADGIFAVSIAEDGWMEYLALQE